jgi:hypothetical protein
MVAATFRSIRQAGQEEVRADRRGGGGSGGDRNVDFYRRTEGAPEGATLAKPFKSLVTVLWLTLRIRGSDG